MTELEEKQVDCPYCHEPFKPWGLYDKDSDYTGNSATIDSVAKQLSIDSDGWNYYDDEPCTDHSSVPIYYCPMCGRKLGVIDEQVN